MTGLVDTLDLDEVTLAGRYFGVYPATVSDNQDPDGQGRVKVRLPWSPDAGSARYELWARLATMMAGDGRGTWFVPEAQDEVLVCFEGGDPRRPIVIGALWNGRDATPETIDANNDIRSITSRAGSKLTMDDTQGSVTVTLETPGGQRLTMTDAGTKITLEDSSGNSIELAPAGITITASSQVKVNASTVDVEAGMVTVNSAMSTFSGVVQCETLIATTVVGTTYTPGVGNIW
jgi:uncharacterized protein involved in type VI secretion and phage assembly